MAAPTGPALSPPMRPALTPLRRLRRTTATRPPCAAAAAALAGTCLWLSAACATLPPPPLLPEPVPYADTLPIPEPEARDFAEAAELFEAGVIAPVEATLDVGRWAGRERVALNLTRMDDVVPSSWFEHRNGRSPMDPEAVRRGVADPPGPDLEGPLVVVRPKGSGIQPGFWIRDARGDLYLLKLDPPAYPRLASAADVVTSRLLHAAGYHVPANYVVALDPSGLVPWPGARVVEGGRERPLTDEDVARELALGARLPDGRVVGVASRFVPGVPKGPWRFEGRRRDDPNDHYRHEHRRELRGLHVVAAWLHHVDIRFENTLDVWIHPPGFLRHYLIDFGSSLGSGGVRPHRPREGSEHNFDLWASARRLATLGFYRAGWEGPWEEPVHPAVGRLPAEDFRPEAWKPNWPNGAWRHLTPADGYWGAKLVGSFTDAQLAAAVEAADLPAGAAAELTRRLAVRRDRTVAYWFRRVTPLERPETERQAPGPAFRVAFEDLGLGLFDGAATRYRWELRHEALGRRWRGEEPATGSGRQTIRIGPRGAGPAAADAPPLLPTEARAYAVLRVWALRDERESRPATLWLLWRGPDVGYEVAALRH